MAGHGKWSKIKRLQGALDVKCDKLFSRLSQEMSSPRKPAQALRPQTSRYEPLNRRPARRPYLSNGQLTLKKINHTPQPPLAVAAHRTASQAPRLCDALEICDDVLAVPVQL